MARRRIDRGRLVLSFAMAAGAALIALGVIGSQTGRDQSSLPDEIERIQPARGDKVLSQANIVVDLVEGYGGRLEIDFVPLPTVTTQEPEPAPGGGASPPAVSATDPNAARFDAGTNTLSFQPRPDGELERFSVGRHFVKVVYWKLVEGESSALSYTWYFEVTA